MRRLTRVAAAALVAASSAGSAEQAAPQADRQRLRIATLSTRADRVSGGNVLAEVVAPGPGALRIVLDGRDVSGAFRATSPGRWMGLVNGLRRGRNTLTADGAAWGLAAESVVITSYPVTGPIVSGPHLQPFVCQTAEFQLPDGATLGPPLDASCSAATRVQHLYLPAGGTELVPLEDSSRLPSDVVRTTTTAGKSVPFVVRLETGTMNRGIYQNMVLHDPTADPAPTPFSPPAGWNRRLIALHGSGCPTGWFRQGGAMGAVPLGPTNVTRLGEGYAIFLNTLNHPTNSCNPFLAGETTMMGKEHFIETFGVPEFTISIGGSGGAYTGLQVGDAFPGLFDAVVATATFPDALSIALAGLDGHLLTRYFAEVNPGGFTDEQKIAITGYATVEAFVDAANQAQRTDPVPDRVDVPGYQSARWHDAVPAAGRYHPTRNPTGARPTIFDVARNIYGIDPATGFARRPYDNVGVQYGLEALNGGAITKTQFLDLNERVGGFDHDANYAAARSAGDEGAIRRAYQGGVTLGGGGGLASIPVFDAGGYNEESRYHYQWFHFAVRERMRRENGHADNHLMWRGPAVPAAETWRVITEWVAAIAADGGPGTPREKMARNRPKDAVDGCWTSEVEGAPPRFTAEPQTFGRRPDSPCNTRLPSYGFVRQVAGGPIAADVLKCQTRPIDARDYAVAFSRDELARLRRIFPTGVCDWSKPGVGQTPVVPWASFGPAPERSIDRATSP